MAKLTLSDLEIGGKKVLVRVDFNVPLTPQGEISDDSRIVASLPTIQYLLKEGGALILMSHLGRPKGQKNSAFSLKVCAQHLEKLLAKPVQMAPDCIGPAVTQLAHSLRPGQILLLENLRFYAAEEQPAKDPSFAKQLAALGDLYINDAFGTSHRPHSSIVALAKLFPHKAAAGLLLNREIQFLGEALLHPRRPFMAILGGAKVSTKLGVIKALLKSVDGLILGGGMCYTFLKAKGIAIGNSLCEETLIPVAQEIMKECTERQIPLLLPEDLIVADRFANNAKIKSISAKEGLPEGYQGMDIGSQTIQKFAQILENAGLILWNGPLGVFEMPHFANGTLAIARTLAASKAVTIVGGGDSVAAINQAGVASKISHISTGGGATLEYIEFGSLPGIDALSDKL